MKTPIWHHSRWLQTVPPYSYQKLQLSHFQEFFASLEVLLWTEIPVRIRFDLVAFSYSVYRLVKIQQLYRLYNVMCQK